MGVHLKFRYSEKAAKFLAYISLTIYNLKVDDWPNFGGLLRISELYLHFKLVDCHLSHQSLIFTLIRVFL